MKHLRLFLAGTLVLTSVLGSKAQDVLPEITVKAVRYKYLRSAHEKDAAQQVNLLQRKAAEYDVKKASFYEEEYDAYFVSFFIPEGQILASYDKEGNLLTTVEKYKNVMLPAVVREAVVKRFPQWIISEDVYFVDYKENKTASKVYKITLENGDKRIKIKTNEKGEFL